MPMFAWGLDEIAEGVGLIYVVIVGMLVLLVKLEQSLDLPTRPRTRLARQISRRWADDATTRTDPVIDWLSRVRSWDASRLGRRLHISADDAVRLLRLAGYQETRNGRWSPVAERRNRNRPHPADARHGHG
jgi:hypothetical protein